MIAIPWRGRFESFGRRTLSSPQLIAIPYIALHDIVARKIYAGRPSDLRAEVGRATLLRHGASGLARCPGPKPSQRALRGRAAIENHHTKPIYYGKR